MNFAKYHILLLTMICYVSAGYGQNLSNQINHYNYLQGNIIRDIINDRYGVVWIATHSGLIRFDGYDFTQFQPTIPETSKTPIMNVGIIHEDVNGGIWIGGDFDLCRFDPALEEFRNYEYKHLLDTVPDLENDSIGTWAPSSIFTAGFRTLLTITSDMQGRVYFGVNPGTYSPSSQPLIFYDPGLDSLRVFPEDKAPELSNVYLSARGPEDMIFFVTLEGVYMMDNDWNIHSVPVNQGTDLKPEHLISRMTVDNEGRLWLVKADTLIRYDVRSSNPMHKAALELSDSHLYSWQFQSDMAVLDNDQVWISTLDGIVLYNTKTNQSRILDIGSRSNNPGIFRYDARFYTDHVYSIHLDAQDNIWLGRSTGDVFRIGNKPLFKTIDDVSLNANWPHIRNLHHDVIWAGDGRDQKRNFFDLTTEKLWRESYREDNPDCNLCHVFGLYNREKLLMFLDGQFWTGLLDLHSQPYQRINIPGLPPGFEEVIRNDNRWKFVSFLDEKDRLWISAEDGFYILDEAKELIEFIDFNAFPRFDSNQDLWINDLDFAQDGKAWIATSAGVYSFDIQTSELKLHGADPTRGDVFHGSFVVSLYVDNKGIVWTAIDERGLAKYNASTGKIQTYTTEHGLQSMKVSSILGDENNDALWLGTYGGLSRFSIEAEQFINFSKSDGLQGLLFGARAAVETSSGYFVFSGKNGINYFHPDSFTTFSAPPKLHFTDFRYVNKPIENSERKEFVAVANNGGKIRLNHDQNSLSIGYIGIQYDEPFKNSYAYTLENFSNEWFKVGNQRTAQFSSLKPGEYIFKVKAANRHGIWTSQPLTLTIEISPPWWATVYAYIFYILVGGLLIWQGIMYLNRRILDKEREAVRKKTEEAKTRFFTNVSHELRTPLTVISGMVEELDTNPKAPELIKRNTDILHQLVDQILDLRKLDAGTLKVNYVQGDVMSYLRYVCESFEMSAKQKGVMMHYDGPQSFMMDYDPDKLVRILGNLLSNAIKFTPTEGDIYLNVKNIHSYGSENLQMTVRDTGPGIPPEALEHIFDRYFQVDHGSAAKNGSGNHWSSDAGGTGIGLAIVKEYVTLLEGDVSVESKSGQGSAFTVTLPVSRTAEIIDVAEGTNTRDDAMEPYWVNSNNDMSEDDLPLVLLVEDNADLVVYVKTCLAGKFQIISAINGIEGRDTAFEQMPDIIISDVMMPGMNGFELCETLKSDIRTSHIPLILLTAKADLDSRLTGLSAGADAYLVKPFNKEELLIRMHTAIDLREKLRARYGSLTELPKKSDPAIRIEDEFVQKVRDEIANQLDNPDFSIKILSKKCAMSERQLQLKLKALTGRTPVQIRTLMRLNKARKLLVSTSLTVSEVAYDSGFRDPSYFGRIFSKEFGVTPTEWRDDHSQNSQQTSVDSPHSNS